MIAVEHGMTCVIYAIVNDDANQTVQMTAAFLYWKQATFALQLKW